MGLALLSRVSGSLECAGLTALSLEHKRLLSKASQALETCHPEERGISCDPYRSENGDAEVEVVFDGVGLKKLLLSFAKLEKVE